ncbi:MULTISPECIES: hypothetical protein [unclassified Lactococcus]|uniref:hypothetical protein n=1 Tax=unclassified Lactococcus TaxID=2643510 RepID=UPI0011C8E3AC|nr:MULTISPECIES: hypothetical protein [unclassified Lactococcus]MQW23506.1 hypothetical protein [Lactococcus sp. dk101]TXK37836.1 hypothetical protein FVP42_07490 [Lactococcus sp. dk310]TXK49306.1 hypothetical protein FVP43_07435 [Lactococcus sp. dk322]
MTDFFKDIKDLVVELADNVDAVKTNVDRVQTELIEAEKTKAAIQKKVEEFQYSAQPRIDKINELLENIKKETTK